MASEKSDNIAMVAVAVTIGGALIFASGALGLIIRLQYLGLSWSPVLGQLPRDLYLSTGVAEVAAPAAAVGFGLRLIAATAKQHRPEWLPRWLALPGFALLLPILFAFIGEWIFGSSRASAHTRAHNGPLSSNDIALEIWIISVVAMLIVWLIHKTGWNELMKSIGFTVTLIPVAASIAACTLLPAVEVCGPAFNLGPQKHHHVLIGNLIGINDSVAYIAQFNEFGGPHNGFISVVPISSQSLIAVGKFAGCGDLPSAK